MVYKNFRVGCGGLKKYIYFAEQQGEVGGEVGWFGGSNPRRFRELGGRYGDEKYCDKTGELAGDEQLPSLRRGELWGDVGRLDGENRGERRGDWTARPHVEERGERRGTGVLDEIERDGDKNGDTVTASF